MKGSVEMFWMGLGIGLIIGANVALILYALILVNKDEKIEDYHQ